MVTIAELRREILANPYVIAVFASSDVEYATWSHSLRIETGRAKELFSREAPHVADQFRFVEVVDFTPEDVSAIIEEMGATPPHGGRSGFTAMWRDGSARLYEGQPQALYLANWLGALETTALFKPLGNKQSRKAFSAQENVRVVGYFESETDPLFKTFLRVAKHFQLDIEFAAVFEPLAAKFFKLKHIGDVAILKPSEPAMIWSQQHASASNSEATSEENNEDGDEEEDEDTPTMWTYETLDKFVQRNRKAVWSEIQITSMFSHWFSVNPKILLVIPNREILTRSESAANSFTNWKALAKQLAKTVGLEFLLLDASIFNNVPDAIQVPIEDLPAVVAFRDSKRIAEHVHRISKDDGAKESLTKMRAFLDAYLHEQQETP